MIKIKSVKIEWVYDESPDVSWLNADTDYHYGTDGCNWEHVDEFTKKGVVKKHGSLRAASEHYAEKDQERLQAFYDNEWHMLGCVAEAVVLVPWGNCHRIERFTSSGLWGIESDCGKDYRHEIEYEQLDDLRDYLKQFGIDISNFWMLYGKQNG